MKRSDLNLNPIRRVVAAMPSRFSTFDVIEHPEMAQLNKRFAAERNYRAEVGKQLKELMGELGITEVQSKTIRSSIWESETLLEARPSNNTPAIRRPTSNTLLLTIPHRLTKSSGHSYP